MEPTDISQGTSWLAWATALSISEPTKYWVLVVRNPMPNVNSLGESVLVLLEC